MSTLPVQLSSFIGRKDEVPRITRWLASERLVTLTGPGGVGKSRLALVVAERSGERFAEGVQFVSLASISDAALVAPTIATSLGLDLGNRSPEELLASALADKHMLLLLDNFEQVVDAAPLVSDLLTACPGLSILATSRMPLRVSGEQQVPVEPLGLPALLDSSDLDRLACSEAVELFVQRARSCKPDFELTPANAPAIALICRQLDGLPLAIELAAPRVKLFTPQDLVDRIAYRLPLLTDGPRNLPARQQTMRDAIAWSYELLTPDQQRLLRQLSVLVGGWTLATAEAVCDPGFDVLNGLSLLVEHSLIQLRQQPDGGSRYAMLGTLREFGLEQLASHGETDAVYRRLARHMLWLFENAGKEWMSPDLPNLLAHADAEIANVRSALGWCVSRDPGVGVRLTISLTWFWNMRCYYQEGQHWLTLALASRQPLTSLARADALCEMGHYAATLGDYAAGIKFLEESLALFREHHHTNGVVRSLFALSRIAMWSANFEQAERLLQEAIELQEAEPDQAQPKPLTGNLGTVLIRRGAFTRAAVILDESLQVARQSNDGMLAALLPQRSYLALKQGELARARDLIAECIELQREVRDVRFSAQALEVAAWVLIAQGRPRRAARLLGAVDRLRESIGVPVPPMIQLDYDEYLPVARASVTRPVWDEAWAEGCSMSFDDAIDDVLGEEAAADPGSFVDPGLSKRENDVLALLAEGRSNQEIAEALFISPSTVANHVTKILNKLGFDSRTAAAIYAVRHGLV